MCDGDVHSCGGAQEGAPRLRSGTASWKKGQLTQLIRKELAKCTDKEKGFPGGTVGKEPACQCQRQKTREFDPWSGRSPAGGNRNPLQCSRQGNPTDRGGWWVTVHGAAKSRTRLSDRAAEGTSHLPEKPGTHRNLFLFMANATRVC